MSRTMRTVKLYTFQSKLDFGQCEGELLKDVFDKSPSYIEWCFQKIDWFCLIDEVFNQLPIVLFLKKDNKDIPLQKNWLKSLIDLHELKKSKIL